MERHLKGWGWEDWIVNNELYCGKILHFKKGKRCSLHYHKKKTETFYILNGDIMLQLGTLKPIFMGKGMTITIEKEVSHRITAITSANILEISTHHEESDSYRIEKGD